MVTHNDDSFIRDIALHSAEWPPTLRLIHCAVIGRGAGAGLIGGVHVTYEGLDLTAPHIIKVDTRR